MSYEDDKVAEVINRALQPHRQKSFKLSNDPFFVEKVRDIVGLYLNSPEKAVVLCVDEKTQIQALDRTQPLLPMGLGYVEGVTHEPFLALCRIAQNGSNVFSF